MAGGHGASGIRTMPYKVRGGTRSPDTSSTKQHTEQPAACVIVKPRPLKYLRELFSAGSLLKESNQVALVESLSQPAEVDTAFTAFLDLYRFQEFKGCLAA